MCPSSDKTILGVQFRCGRQLPTAGGDSGSGGWGNRPTAGGDSGSGWGNRPTAGGDSGSGASGNLPTAGHASSTAFTTTSAVFTTALTMAVSRPASANVDVATIVMATRITVRRRPHMSFVPFPVALGV